VKRFIIRSCKVLGWCIAIVVLVPLLGILYYDLTEFQPRRDEIAQLIANASPAERSPPPMLRRLELTDSRGDLSWSAARLLLFTLDVPDEWHRASSWHMHGALWWVLVRVHLSEGEQLTIICSATFLGRRSQGFEAGAQSYFQRPLNRLADAELATLVVISRAPSRWNRPGAFDEIAVPRDRLLAHTRSGEPFPD